MTKQTFTRQEVITIIEDILMMADKVMDAIQSENPEMDAKEFLEAVEK